MNQPNTMIDLAWSTFPMRKEYKMPLQAMVGIINDSDTSARLPVKFKGLNTRVSIAHVTSLRIMKIHDDLSEWAPPGNGMTQEMIDQYLVFTLRATVTFNPFFLNKYPVRTSDSGQLLARPQLEFVSCPKTRLFTGLQIKNWREIFRFP